MMKKGRHLSLPSSQDYKCLLRTPLLLSIYRQLHFTPCITCTYHVRPSCRAQDRLSQQTSSSIPKSVTSLLLISSYEKRSTVRGEREPDATTWLQETTSRQTFCKKLGGCGGLGGGSWRFYSSLRACVPRGYKVVTRVDHSCKPSRN